MILRRFEADRADPATSQLAQEEVGGAIEIDVATRAQGAALASDGLEQRDGA